MSTSDPNELPVLEAAVPCRHLRNKGMYIYTDGSGGESHDGYDNSIYWCLQTMKGFGPDDDLVAGEDCRNPGRSCYEPL
ncbi:MAG: hypothetical protein AB7I30_03615 [Isosphaeraceae bacterium]